MTKKDYLLAILKQLGESWAMAKPLQILVESNALNDKTLESIIQIMKEGMKYAEKQVDTEKMQKSLDVLERLKKIENISKAKDQKDINDLENMIDAI